MGKPLIAWTIEAALNADVELDIVVSTDSEEIASISKSFGAEVPFLRPAILAEDTTSTIAVIDYTLKELEKEGRIYDELLLLQPTSPLRTSNDIEKALQFFKQKKADAVISVSQSDIPASWFMHLDNSYSLQQFIEQKENATNTRSQELEHFHYLNGAIYIIKTKSFTAHQSLYSPNMRCFAYPMGQINGLDIDTEEALILAELYLQMKSSHQDLHQTQTLR